MREREREMERERERERKRKRKRKRKRERERRGRERGGDREREGERRRAGDLPRSKSVWYITSGRLHRCAEMPCRRQHNIDLSATNNIYNYRNAFDTHAMHTGNMTVRFGLG